MFVYLTIFVLLETYLIADGLIGPPSEPADPFKWQAMLWVRAALHGSKYGQPESASDSLEET